MRISTSTLFESGSAKLSDLQTSLMRAQQQIASGRKILTPADDPVGAARALEVSQSQATNDQYASNRQNVKSSLDLTESTLSSVTSLIQDVQTTVVQAGDGSMDDTQRKDLANALSGRLNELIGLANTRDDTGNFLFSGFQTQTQPYTASPTGATYAGDQGQRMLQVSSTRQLNLTVTGNAAFDQIKTGNGTFVTSAASTNAGSGVISQGSVVTPSALTGHTYSIKFSVVGNATTYDVIDTTTSTTLSTANAYSSGQSISFDGLQFDIQGTPVNGDTFTVAPATNQSLFTTIKNLITTLSTPATGAAGQTQLASGLATASINLSNALDNVLSVRAGVGANLKELDSLDTQGQDTSLEYSQILSQLQDLDYSKAITNLNQQQMTLQAAQQSFIKISNLSVFNYL